MSPTNTVQIDHQQLLAVAQGVEPLPANVARLAQLVSDAESSMKEIVEVISYDQALTATLLRRANAAALGGRQAISSVHDAAVRLGPGSLLAMALSTSVSKKMHRALPEYGLKEGQLWRNSVAAALSAETVRAASSVPIPPEVVTAALLHDFGKVVLANHFGPQVLDMLNAAAQNDKLELVEAEQAIFGATHADVGGIVAQSWKLPGTIVDGIIHHHATRAGLPPICSAVAIAHLMAHDVVGEGCAEETPADFADRVEAHTDVIVDLGIDPDRYPVLVADARRRFEQLAVRFGLS